MKKLIDVLCVVLLGLLVLEASVRLRDYWAPEVYVLPVAVKDCGGEGTAI